MRDSDSYFKTNPKMPTLGTGDMCRGRIMCPDDAPSFARKKLTGWFCVLSFDT